MTASVAEIPRPEHPRPDFMRPAWLNLNGEWEFAETDDEKEDFRVKPLPDRIVVPFCRESKLSGLERKGFVKQVWYRKSFEIPAEWAGKRVLLHIGACDWETTAWLNGSELGTHRGGSTPFTFELTHALAPGSNTLVLKVYDDHRTGCQASGKQSDRVESYGCMYTRTTGIWQTVWLEAVPETYLENHSVVTDPESGSLSVTVRVNGPWAGIQLAAEAFAEGKSVGRAQTALEWGVTQLTGTIAFKRSWSPKDPFLYDLKLWLLKDGKVLDEVSSYFGFRKVEVRGRAILLSGEPLFQRLVLDQGFYPDGIWTAPSDQALERDIRLSMAAGFNGARLHQKVFEPRFLYHADRLGYLVWGEYPNWGLNYSDPRIDEPVIREWTEILSRDFNHPAIVGWCPFNETSQQAARIQNIVVALTRQIDPTRPVLDTSGWTHTSPAADLSDAHDYDQSPESYRARWDAFFDPRRALPARYGILSGVTLEKPFFVSEFGGIGWNVEGGWGYGNAPKTLDEFHARFEGLVNANLENPNVFGYCYTQLTDVEQERNGIYTYNREAKFDNARLRAVQTMTAAYESNPPTAPPSSPIRDWKTLIPTAHERAPGDEWTYATEDPGAGWEAPGFDDSKWPKGLPGFGSQEGPLRGTEWTGKDIWIRREFRHDGSGFDVALLLLWYDNGTEVYLNGKEIGRFSGYNHRHEAFELTDTIRATLETGRNVLAIHTHQDDGGQVIDAGLLLGREQP
ncbi:MAG: beta-galactosidase [Candidatus Omnitrophica bacterium]|nr:beta-galactosidase [Candidatus Omnitrophota bacterium]